MAPWWWFPCKPKHVGAVLLILKCFNNPTFFNVVCIAWKTKCWILLMHGVTMKFIRAHINLASYFCSKYPRPNALPLHTNQHVLVQTVSPPKNSPTQPLFNNSQTALNYVLLLLYICHGSSVGIATRYGLDGQGIESRWEARFSAPVQTGPGAHPASYTMGTGSLVRR